MSEKVNVMLYGDGGRRANYAIEIWCDRPDDCPLRADGRCACARRFLDESHCPYGEKRTVRGYTKRAMKYGEFCQQYRNDPMYGALKAVNGVHVRVVGDYVMLAIPSVSMVESEERPYCASSVADGLYICTRFARSLVSWVRTEKLDSEAFVKILDYRPQTIIGYDEIKEYQKSDVPNIIEELRRYWPEMYGEIVDLRPDFALRSPVYVGRNAKTATLADGIEIPTRGGVFVKQGGFLTCEQYKGAYFHLGWKTEETGCYVRIPIADGSVTEVKDNGWVVPGVTEFV